MPISVVAAVVVLLLGLFLVFAMLRSSARKESSVPAIGRDASRSPEAAPLAGGERLASAASEQIEDLVRKRLAADPEISGMAVDFGSAPDGTLEIWIDDHRYTAVDEIPHARVRDAVRAAVSEFNSARDSAVES